MFFRWPILLLLMILVGEAGRQAKGRTGRAQRGSKGGPDFASWRKPIKAAVWGGGRRQPAPFSFSVKNESAGAGALAADGRSSGGVGDPDAPEARAPLLGSRDAVLVAVAGNNESVRWLRQVADFAEVVVYATQEDLARVAEDLGVVGESHELVAVGNFSSHGRHHIDVRVQQVCCVDGPTYLQFIVEEYGNQALPGLVFFIHAHSNSYHDPVLPKERLIQDFIHRWKGKDLSHLPTDTCIAPDELDWAFYHHHLEAELGPSPEKKPLEEHAWLKAEPGALWYESPSAAQFVTTPEAIRRHPKAFYEKLMAVATKPSKEESAENGDGGAWTWQVGTHLEVWWKAILAFCPKGKGEAQGGGLWSCSALKSEDSCVSLPQGETPDSRAGTEGLLFRRLAFSEEGRPLGHIGSAPLDPVAEIGDFPWGVQVKAKKDLDVDHPGPISVLRQELRKEGSGKSSFLDPGRRQQTNVQRPSIDAAAPKVDRRWGTPSRRQRKGTESRKHRHHREGSENHKMTFPFPFFL